MEPMSTKIGISLPTDLLEEIERRRARSGVTRSHMIREAVEQYLRSLERAEEERAYAEAYRRMPEAPEEIAEIEAFQAASWRAIAKELPWEDE